MKNSPKFRIVFTSVMEIEANTLKEAQETYDSMSDDFDEFSLEADFLEAKIQKKVNIALPYENNGKPVNVWKNC